MGYIAGSRRRAHVTNMVLFALLVAALWGAYRLLFATHGDHMPPPPAAPAVSVLAVTPADIPLVFEYPARLVGSREVEIRARVSGILLKRAYTEGQYVKRGDLLFVIDPAPYKAALAQARATNEQAARDYRRAAVLQKQNAISPREFDAAKAAAEAAKAAVDAARINLAYTTVRAPFSGYTSEETHSEGTLVVENSTLLTRLTQLDPIYVEFAYPDSEAALQRQALANGTMRLPTGGLLSVELVGADGASLGSEGNIRFTDNIIDLATGTVRARAVVDNKDRRTLPGQFIRARVKGLTMANAIAIPERAVLQGPMGTFVYTVTAEGKAAITPVKLGLLNHGMQVISEGLHPADRVIVEGMIKVKPDAAVCVDTGTPDSPCAPAGQNAKPNAPNAATPSADKPKA